MELARTLLLVACASVALPALAAGAPETHELDKVEGPTRVGDRGGVPVYHEEFVTSVYDIDRIYHSMAGPQTVDDFAIHFDGQPSELLWMTGFHAEIVSPDESKTLSREFMCHANVMFDPATFRRRFPTQLHSGHGRLFSLAQGQLSIELPEGFGVPLMSGEPMRMASQVLNHNIADREVQMRQRLAIEFVRDRDLSKPYVPLVPIAAQAAVLVEGRDGYFGLDHDEIDPEKQGQGCSLEQPASDGHVFDDGKGRKFSSFWVVPPGRQVSRSLVTKWLALPYDTTAHYIAVHVHPYAESVELYDLTAKKSVYKATMKQTPGRIGLEAVDAYSSAEGLPLYKDHEYELISTYNNTSKQDSDAMSVMFLYVKARDLYDFDFRPRPQTASEQTESRADTGSDRVGKKQGVR